VSQPNSLGKPPVRLVRPTRITKFIKQTFDKSGGSQYGIGVSVSFLEQPTHYQLELMSKTDPWNRAKKKTRHALSVFLTCFHPLGFIPEIRYGKGRDAKNNETATTTTTTTDRHPPPPFFSSLLFIFFFLPIPCLAHKLFQLHFLHDAVRVN